MRKKPLVIQNKRRRNFTVFVQAPEKKLNLALTFPAGLVGSTWHQREHSETQNWAPWRVESNKSDVDIGSILGQIFQILL